MYLFTCVFVYLYICVIVYVYLHIRYSWTLFLRSSYHNLFKNIAHVVPMFNFNQSCICVFVYLCICIFVFVRTARGNIIFDILEQSSFQKYTTCWVFLALRHMLYLCICVFVFVYLCMRHLVISVLISWDQELSENIWFVWPKAS